METELKFMEELKQDKQQIKTALILMNGPEDGRVFHIDKDMVIIGRADTADIRLWMDMWVSRRHAELKKEGDKYFIKDIGSSHGIKINSKPIPPEKNVELLPDTMITLGKTELKFVCNPDAMNSGVQANVAREEGKSN